jgi:nucleotide-binding universal stress UspA family protein
MSQANQRTVVLAVDDSETARHAFDWAVSNLLNKEHDHLRLIHVQPFHEVTDVIASAEMAVPVYSAGKVREDSLNIARKYAKICKETGILNFKEDIILEDGSAGAAICEYIEGMKKESKEQQITLVLGSRELGFFGRAFIGSTSEHCVRHCSCPVVVVKLPPKSKA